MVDVTHQTDDSIRLTLRLSASAYEGIVELSMASRRRFNPQLSYQLDIAMRSGAEFIKLLPSYTCRLKHEEVREAGIRLPVEIHKFVQSVAVQTGYSQNAIINAMALYTVERPQCSREDAAAAFMRSLLPEHTRRALEQRAFDKGVSQMTLAAEIIQEALAD